MGPKVISSISFHFAKWYTKKFCTETYAYIENKDGTLNKYNVTVTSFLFLTKEVMHRIDEPEQDTETIVIPGVEDLLNGGLKEDPPSDADLGKFFDE